jgi:hypothetical protein
MIGSVLINGHRLPSLLAKMALTGEWGPAIKGFDQSSLPIAEELALLDIQGMEDNTSELYQAFHRGEGPLFGLRDASTLEDGALNIRAAVMIAATYGQEALVLDYSASEEVPRVMATNYSDQVRWEVICHDFESLLNILKLTEAT